MNAFQYARVATGDAAIALKTEHEGAAFLAGGTSVVDLMTQGAMRRRSWSTSMLCRIGKWRRRKMVRC